MIPTKALFLALCLCLCFLFACRRRSGESPGSIWYIYGLWDSEMSPDVRRAIDRNSKVCSDFESVVIGKAEVAGTIQDWKYLSEMINRKVVLADISRYYLMWKRGGFYLDVDVRVNRDLKPLVQRCVKRGKRIMLFTEHDNSMVLGVGEKHRHRIYNCMFWSEPNEMFWKQCYDLAVERCSSLTRWSDSDILWASGPDVITTVYHSTPGNHIHVLNNSESKKYLTHLEKGSWRKKRDFL